MRATLLVPLLVLIPFLLPPTHATPPATVTVRDFAFVDDASGTTRTTIAAGSTVTWHWLATNEAPHTATQTLVVGPGLLDAPFDSGTLEAGASYSVTFGSAGLYQYHCALHGSMTGQVLVTL
jgi:plastocyanin